ncbi:MAG: lipase, partial [Propionibacterium sp.]|nr:lipase [Propionibacterium sp.]
MISTTLTPDLVRGHRRPRADISRGRPPPAPRWVRRQFPDSQPPAMEAQPSGVRVEFSTSASRIDMDLRSGASSAHHGPSHTTVVANLGHRAKSVQPWLPHNETVELIDLRTDRPVEAERRPQRVWMHHGSSISQESNALAPSQTWPAVAARRAATCTCATSVSAAAPWSTPFSHGSIRDTPADVISVKLGINVVNLDAMRLRAFVPAVHGFLDTIRDGHPTTSL